MTWKHRLATAAAIRLGRRGYEVRRHPAARRQAILQRAEVDLVLDVGAADGGYGSTLRAFGYTGPIVSFEPMNAAFEALSRTVADDPEWFARRLALGAEPGTATLNVASNRTSSSMLPMLDAHVDAAPHVRYIATETIEVARLDDVAADVLGDARRPFLKIDTQGFERDVLAGAVATIPRLAGLQLELSFVELYEGGMLVDEAIAWAYEAGFVLAVVEQGYAAPSGEILQIDGVFIRPDEHVY